MVLFSVSHKAIKGIPLHSAKSLVQWIIVNCSQLGYPVTSGPCVLTSSATGAPCRPLPGPPPSTSQVCSHSCRLKFEPIPMNPEAMAMKHESYRGFYRLRPPFFRPIDLVLPGRGNTNESLHPSVIERYKNDYTYRPENIKGYFNRQSIV